MQATLIYRVPVYIDWLDQGGNTRLTTGQQLEMAVHELLLAQSPWTDEWQVEVPYAAQIQGRARLLNVKTDDARNQAILTIGFQVPWTPRYSGRMAEIIQVFLKTKLNRFCQRTVFGIKQARLAVRFAGNVALTGKRYDLNFSME